MNDDTKPSEVLSNMLFVVASEVGRLFEDQDDRFAADVRSIAVRSDGHGTDPFGPATLLNDNKAGELYGIRFEIRYGQTYKDLRAYWIEADRDGVFRMPHSSTYDFDSDGTLAELAGRVHDEFKWEPLSTAEWVELTGGKDDG